MNKCKYKYNIFNYLTMSHGTFIVNYLNHSLTHGKIKVVGTINITFIIY